MSPLWGLADDAATHRVHERPRGHPFPSAVGLGAELLVPMVTLQSTSGGACQTVLHAAGGCSAHNRSGVCQAPRLDSSHPGGCEGVSHGRPDAHFPSQVFSWSPVWASGCRASGCTWDGDSHRPRVLLQVGQRIRGRHSEKPRNQGLACCQGVTGSAIRPPGACMDFPFDNPETTFHSRDGCPGGHSCVSGNIPDGRDWCEHRGTEREEPRRAAGPP